jgi:hypothetical protein
MTTHLCLLHATECLLRAGRYTGLASVAATRGDFELAGHFAGSADRIYDVAQRELRAVERRQP